MQTNLNRSGIVKLELFKNGPVVKDLIAYNSVAGNNLNFSIAIVGDARAESVNFSK